jgi:cytochrome c peroxidase
VLLNVLSIREMAGAIGSNPVADMVVADRPEQAWVLLAERLRGIPEYVERFRAAFEDIDRSEDITLVHAANAIAAFEASAFRCTDAPFDQALRGDLAVISPLAWRGAELFFNELGCVDCHGGPFLTDHRFHALAVPQIGPGRGDNQPGYFDGLDDFGREQVTGDPADRFRFRTPGLRQVALTGPWGHSGAFASLEAMVRHHLDPVASLETYDSTQARFPAGTLEPERDHAVQNDPERRAAIAAAAELPAREVDDEAIRALLAFLRETLTDHGCMERLHGLIPERVPSGLPLAD